MLFKLHHIGCAVADLQIAIKYYVDIFGYEYCFEIQNSADNLKAAFLKKENTYLELLQVAEKEKSSVIDKIISTLGGGVYHHCYEVYDIEEAIEFLMYNDFIKFSKNIKRNEHYKSIFMISPDNYLIEVLEENK